MQRKTDSAHDTFSGTRECLVMSMGKYKSGSQEREEQLALYGLAGGLMHLSLAVRDIYDKLLEIEKKLPK